MFTLTPILVGIRPIVYEILTKTFVCNGRIDLQTDQRPDRQTTQTIQGNVSNNTLNLSAKFETNRTNHSWLQPKPIFQKIVNLTLTFDPMTLTSYQSLALIDVYPHTYFGFNPTNVKRDIDKNVCLLPTNQRTDQRTDQRTNQRTNQQNYS